VGAVSVVGKKTATMTAKRDLIPGPSPKEKGAPV